MYGDGAADPPVASCLLSTGQNDQPEFPEALQSRAPHQAAAAGLHHTHPAVDLRSVLQGDATLGSLNTQAHTQQHVGQSR